MLRNGTAGKITLPQAAYIAQSDPFFAKLKAWGDTIWQLWDHNRDVPGAAPILMAQTTQVADGAIVVEKQTVPDGASQTFDFSGDAAGNIADGQQIATASWCIPGSATGDGIDKLDSGTIMSVAC